jgi:hypothetical protein
VTAGIVIDSTGRTLPVPPPMLPEERRVADLLNEMPRPRGVHTAARVLRVDVSDDTVTWTDGRVTPIIPPKYVA